MWTARVGVENTTSFTCKRLFVDKAMLSSNSNGVVVKGGSIVNIAVMESDLGLEQLHFVQKIPLRCAKPPFQLCQGDSSRIPRFGLGFLVCRCQCNQRQIENLIHQLWISHCRDYLAILVCHFRSQFIPSKHICQNHSRKVVLIFDSDLVLSLNHSAEQILTTVTQFCWVVRFSNKAPNKAFVHLDTCEGVICVHFFHLFVVATHLVCKGFKIGPRLNPEDNRKIGVSTCKFNITGG
mmetsp:Transcript_36230/g.73673  ORF Transcript_36230/g.73673 Transcript_36230/m.73673 type:complete len:237 (-) Transcript_36230:989-1699(-)